MVELPYNTTMTQFQAETAKEIGRILGAVAKRADAASLHFLAYLVRMAEIEARSEAAKVDGSPPTAG